MKSCMLSNQSLSLYITPLLCTKREQSSLSHPSLHGNGEVWFQRPKGCCCPTEAATLTVTQTDISSWMELNQDYGAWKSASLAVHVHVKISYREKLTESTRTALTSSALLWGETSLTSEDLTCIQLQQDKFGDQSLAEHSGFWFTCEWNRKLKV